MTNGKIKISQDEIIQHLLLAKERIRSAKLLMKAMLYNDATSRAYYVFFDAATAALLSEGKIAKTHAGLIILFSFYFVKNEKVHPKFIRLFKKAKEAREEADYEIYKKFSKEEVEMVIRVAEEFVAEIERIVKK